MVCSSVRIRSSGGFGQCLAKQAGGSTMFGAVRAMFRSRVLSKAHSKGSRGGVSRRDESGDEDKDRVTPLSGTPLHRYSEPRSQVGTITERGWEFSFSLTSSVVRSEVIIPNNQFWCVRLQARIHCMKWHARDF